MSLRRTVSYSVGFCAALACAAAFAQRTSSADRVSTHGFAVVRVASNGGQPFQTVTVEEVGGRGRNSHLGGPLLISYDNPVTFGGWLPAGEYRFLRFDSTGLGGFTGRVDLEDLLPTFSVEAGRLTDLGTPVEHFFGTTDDGGKTRTRQGQVPGICGRALYLPPTDEMVCLRNDGSILTTRAGKEWTVERIVY